MWNEKLLVTFVAMPLLRRLLLVPFVAMPGAKLRVRSFLFVGSTDVWGGECWKAMSWKARRKRKKTRKMKKRTRRT